MNKNNNLKDVQKHRGLMKLLGNNPTNIVQNGQIKNMNMIAKI